MKKFLIILLTILMYAVPASADGEITVKLDGEALTFDVQPQIIDERTMVPMRGIFEALGASVTWVPEQSLIVSTKGSRFISMQIGAPNIVIHDVATNKSSVYTMDVTPVIIDDRTLVPVRAVSESMDCTVEWEQETQTVIINTKTDE